MFFWKSRRQYLQGIDFRRRWNEDYTKKTRDGIHALERSFAAWESIAAIGQLQ